MTHLNLIKSAGLSALLASAAAFPAQAVFFHTTSGSIDGSLCVGNDCVSSESFGFDTIRMKENNLRLHYDDTSSTASFPNVDWRVRINDSSNGGASFYAIENASAGRAPFRIDDGARTNALYIDDQGDVGIGTSTPATNIDIKTGNTPTVRLQQDGTSGFTPQTWDLAGNEAGFFIRDATGGSTLPFRIITGGAPSQSLVIDGDGDVGIGAGTNPQAPLEIERSDAFVFLRLTATGADPNDSVDITYTDAGAAGELRYNIIDGDSQEMSLDADGNMTIAGNLVTGGGGTCDPGPCDAVFDPAVYTVPSIEDHAALMWDNRFLPAVGPTRPGEPINVTIKLTRMLNELEHAHIYIEELHQRIKVLEEVLAEKG